MNIKNNSAPKVVGAVKNQFGTRLSYKVTCQKCQKIDYVAINASKSKQLCRICAQEVLKVYEAGRVISSQNKSCNCTKCSKSFVLDAKVLQKKITNKQDILCSDCYLGFDVWRGKANRNIALSNSQFIKTTPYTILRKSKNEQ